MHRLFLCALFCFCFVWVCSASEKSSLSDCPCSNKNLCVPLRTPPRKEVFSFVVSLDNWKLYDWDQITTIILFGFNLWDPELYCYAHSRGVRVVFATSFPVDQLGNETAKSDWIDTLLKNVKKTWTDGVNIDLEDPIPDHSAGQQQLTQLVGNLTGRFHKEIPGSQVTYDVAWSPDCIDLRCYDHKGLADATDFLFVMSYDLRSQIKTGPCVASANSPINQVKKGVYEFMRLGISTDKLVLGVPWYGYDYPCLPSSLPEANVGDSASLCYLKYIPFRGVNCSDAAGSEKPFGLVSQILKNSTTGRLWDNYLKAPYFEFIDTSSSQRHQMWYDDLESLSLRYSFAKELGLRGLGMWNADSLDYQSRDPAVLQMNDAMWKAIGSIRT